MDPLSQGLTGAVLSQSASNSKDIRYATAAGMAGGMLADIDVLISSSSDPLLHLDFHRHFTHALIFVPIGGLFAALLLWPILRHKIEFKKLYLFSTLGYLTAGFLDACTSYGTHLLWPFSNERLSWNIISIIDPIYTITLLVGVLLALVKFRPAFARVALVLGASYLIFGMTQCDQAQNLMENIAAQRGDQIIRSEMKPTMANHFLWRGIYQTKDQYHVDAYRLGLFTDKQVFQGETRPLFNLQKDLPDLDPQSTIAQDISRFSHFSDGYLVLEQDNIIGDLRYSMLPTSTKPLWGIVMDFDQPMQHVRFENFRKISKPERQRLIDMLRGKDCSIELACINHRTAE